MMPVIHHDHDHNDETLITPLQRRVHAQPSPAVVFARAYARAHGFHKIDYRKAIARRSLEKMGFNPALEAMLLGLEYKSRDNHQRQQPSIECDLSELSLHNRTGISPMAAVMPPLHEEEMVLQTPVKPSTDRRRPVYKRHSPRQPALLGGTGPSPNTRLPPPPPPTSSRFRITHEPLYSINDDDDGTMEVVDIC